MPRTILFGATGTIGRATLTALLARGHDVLCPVRAPPHDPDPAAQYVAVDVRDPGSVAEAFRVGRPDHVVSCLASRSGAPADAWAIDHEAHLHILAAARAAGGPPFVLLSALCVQKPRLAFQHAKLAFERALIQSGLTHSIVRPTAYFKSLSGQIGRVRRGKPFLVFGDGRLTACKPVSDRDLAAYLADCLTTPARHNRVLPIGGPGPALTPRDQAETLFGLLGRTPRIRSVPVGVLDAIIGALSAGGRLVPGLAAKAELARIGRYYATESMLVLDPATAGYDAAATPETGSDTLAGFYRSILDGAPPPDRADHAVF